MIVQTDSHSPRPQMRAGADRQAAELSARLWSISGDLRGNMDASRFKDYILGLLFYRCLSERSQEGSSLEYRLEPRFLFSSMIQRIRDGSFSLTLLQEAVDSLTASAVTPAAKAAFDGIFDSMDLHSRELGRDEAQRTKLIAQVLSKIDGLPLSASQADMDVLGTAYMILIGLFASDAGKKGGEFFTPVQFSRLCARLACLGLENVPSVCDPAMGSASMLLEVLGQPGLSVEHVYGQEKNRTTYNLARMNMLIHGLPCGRFTFFNDDTIASDQFGSRKFTVQVANPPYSQKWDADPEFLSDPRFQGPGRLAPRSYEDFAFIQHMVWHMEENGRAAVLLPHGVLFRGGAEADIRAWLIRDADVLDAVIGLPAGCFHSTPIPVCCLVFRKNRGERRGRILFVDASGDFVPGKKQNTISDGALERIVSAYSAWEEVPGYCRPISSEEIRENGYNLNISRYVDTREPEPDLDLAAIQKDLSARRARCRALEKEVDAYLSRLGLGSPHADSDPHT